MPSVRVLRAAMALAAVAVALPPLASAQSGIQARRVQFTRGTSSAKVGGKITGDQIIDYLVGAKAGQRIKVALSTQSTSAYFNVMEPGEMEVAIYNGSVDGNSYEGTLARSGDYRIRVYLMRSAARRNASASYDLTVSVTGGGAAPSHDAKVAGTDFHATGNIQCAMAAGAPFGPCPFGVKREGGGSGMVTITRPDGRTRTVFFDKGKATGYDQSQSDTGAFRASREGDMTTVRIGAEQYRIPDAVIFGG